MKTKIILVLLIMLPVIVAKATVSENRQVIQTATLKNGSVLYGYIQNNDGYGNLVFHTDSATIILDNVVADVTDRTVNYSQLSDRWKDWAEHNEAFDGTATDKYLVLSDISIRTVSAKDDKFLSNMKSKLVSNVKLLERGVKYKYVEMGSNFYKLNWDDIAAISAERRSKAALSGINWICQTKNGQTFEGQYAGETKSTTSLYLNNGVKQTMNKNDVIKYTYRTINSSQGIFEQSELLDVVRTANLGTISGIIIEQNYTSNKNVDNYVLIQQESGTIQSLRMSDISSISKERNKKYSPLYDIIIHAGEVYINGNSVSCDTIVKSKKGIYSLKSAKSLEVKKGTNDLTTIQIQYSAKSIGNNVEVFRVFPLKKEIKGKKEIFYFDDETLANFIYRPVSIGTTANMTTKAVYQLNGSGHFFFYDPRTKTGYSVIIF